MKNLKREIIIYIGVLIVMAAIWHNSSLLDKLSTVISIDNPFHPLEWALAGYILLWLPRMILIGIKKYLTKVEK